MSAVKSTGSQGPSWRSWGQGRVFSCYIEWTPGGKCLSLFSYAIKITKAGRAQRTEVHLVHHCTAGGGENHTADGVAMSGAYMEEITRLN